MKTSIWKLTSVLLCLTLLLTACSGGETSSEAQSPSAGSPVQTQTSGGGGGDPEPIKLVFATYKQDWQGALEKIIAIYEEDNPHVTIELYIAHNSEYWDNLKAMAAAGTLPNIMRLRGDTQMLQWMDYLVDLTDSKAVAAIPDQFKEAFLVNGKYYGVNVNFEIHGQAYNRNMLKAAGVESVPTTKQEFLDMCEKLAASGQAGGIAMFKDTSMWVTHLGMIPFAYSGNAAQHYDDLISGRVDPVTDPGWNYWYDWLEMMVANCQPNPLQMDSSTGRIELFADKYSFSAHDGSWLQNISYEFNPEFRNYAMLGPYTFSDNPDENHIGMVAQGETVTNVGGEAVVAEAKKFFDFYICDDRVAEILINEASALLTRSDYEMTEEMVGPLNYQGLQMVEEHKSFVNAYIIIDELANSWRAITQRFVAGEMSRQDALSATGELFRSYNGR